MSVVVIGRGKVGRTLARLLRAAEVDVALRKGRGSLRALDGAHVFVLTVPDADISACAERLAPYVTSRSVVLHCAGARGPSELAVCKARGAAVAGFHPLVSFASARSLTSLRGATFVVDGDDKAVRSARALSRKLGARCVARPVLGAAYHAAAALTANGTAALTFSAQRTLEALGMSPMQAATALAGLLHTVADNIAQVGLPEALTGPVRRGDKATVRRHVRALESLSKPLARDYRRVQPIIEACARAALAQRHK